MVIGAIESSFVESQRVRADGLGPYDPDSLNADTTIPAACESTAYFTDHVAQLIALK